MKKIGIELNQEYITAYRNAAKELRLEEFKTIQGDCVEITSDRDKMGSILDGERISMVLIDPPYANMMAKEKTGADIAVYGKNATPFTESKKDLGNMDRKCFLESLKQSIFNILPYVKKNGYIIIFTKDMQPKGKELNMLHYEITQKINEIENINYKGMKIWADESSKLYPYGYPFSFVANQIHQYILVFRKEK